MKIMMKQRLSMLQLYKGCKVVRENHNEEFLK